MTQLIIDADTHVTEPAGVWVDRMSASKWGDLIPHVRRDEQDRECWYVGDKRMGLVTSSSFIRQNPETGERYREVPSGTFFSGGGYDELHPSSYDAKARLAAMDELGLYGAVCYPNLNLVVADLHEAVEDPAYKIDVIRAYNDWMVEWASEDSNRLIPTALVAYFDPEVAATEIYRCAELGHKGLVMTGMPQLHGHPPLASDHWAPLFRAAEETRLSIGFHVGANEQMLTKYVNQDRLAAEGPLRMGARTVTEALLDNAGVMNDLLVSGVLPKYPELKFVMVETGMGWVNFCLEAADYHFSRYGVAKEHTEFTEVPSFYFRRQVYTTYWFEKMDPFHVEHVGSRNIMFETDYPHSTSLDAEDVQWVLKEGLAGVSPEDRDRILYKNAAELYRIDLPVTAGS